MMVLLCGARRAGRKWVAAAWPGRLLPLVVVLLLAASCMSGSSLEQDDICAPSAFMNESCTDDAAHRIAQATVPTAADCCSECAKRSNCAFFTFWGGDICYMFDNQPQTHHKKGCVSAKVHKPSPSSPWVPPPPHGPVCRDCPNIIFSLTDDQDLLLGGWEPMVRTKALLQDKGIMLDQYRVHTPICSPSRSETISGRYYHNIKSNVAVPPQHVLPAATAHVNASYYTNQTFGRNLREKRGYQTGLFGKSNFNTMEGFDRWFAGAILGYGGTWQDNESPSFEYHANKTEYATSLLGNKTIEWLERRNVTGDQNDGRPFFLYFAPHCPHIPATPADWYADACKDVRAPRIPNYNYTSPLFHHLISSQRPLDQSDATNIDALARLRCQCLLSVDDAHAAIHDTLERLGVANNTYWFVSSDHGYNLGNHRLPSNKFLLYEHSLRVPMVIKGPGIQANGTNSVLATNVDYAPTWLSMADIETPEYMDGRSFLPALLSAEAQKDVVVPGSVKRYLAKHPPVDPQAFRKDQFVQYYNQGPWHTNDWKDGLNRTLDDYSNTYIGLTVRDPSLGTPFLKYGEYEYACNTTEILAHNCFPHPDWYELFDIDRDPYELTNIYNNASQALKDELHKRLRAYYPCKGPQCP